MYEASKPGRRAWPPIPDQLVMAELSALTFRCWQRGTLRTESYLNQLRLGRWVLAPTITIRQVL